MKLCSEYMETNLKNDKKFIQISGNYNFAHIHLFLNIGANSDPYNKKGICHLCEHIFIESIIEAYSNKIIDKNFYCIGYTDYDYTVFKFIVSNTNEHVTFLLSILHEYINSFSVKLRYIEKCKSEVIKEFTDRKEDIRRSFKINSFLTENKIDYVPMGRIDDIYKLSIEDVEVYYRQYASNANLVVFCNPSIRKFSCNNLAIGCSQLNNKKINENIEYKNITNNKILNIDSRYRQQLKVYFKYTNRVFNEKENAAIYILEIIMNYKICTLLDINIEEFSPISFKRKIIDNDYVFFILCINKYEEKKESNIIKFVDNILEISISNIDVEQAKNVFYELINQIDYVDEGYTHNNIFHYLTNNELLAVTKEQVNTLRNMVKCISLEEICKIKEKIYNDNYKVITNNLDNSKIQ
ncbi:insulinase family protein [Clostridium tagluense]|uniref:insulinase family protein n=1 Tax=Clostridium tagluense TaxID=360422 RepID=UPI001CF293DC|nr:insulinase family protein [Clostridium tagluense]MCB2314113.1 insulinase family protein [Clostridium tagluense]MCB2318828.1 insulinase family protein [Clostridium tagluense]MCB2323838.1 insulinase family protein [Clostridium tagluense]MCB2328671.1 insulinase family protein [Clostridium tagluense]MCB2333555.1 insulinase family protein [Clostridium tagluense]